MTAAFTWPCFDPGNVVFVPHHHISCGNHHWDPTIYGVACPFGCYDEDDA